MIYDCFIFNDELDLLELRLRLLADVVDKFVLVESERTLSGNKKPLHYSKNKERFSRYADKIIHLTAPVNNMPAWDYEFYQRNFIKEGLKNCNDTDIAFISDADEIVNIKAVLNSDEFILPALIEIPMNYYFLNIITNSVYSVNLVASWSFIKNKDIGYRFKGYPALTGNIITGREIITGWHFSYLFGHNTSRYQEKIQSFSHQEYNMPYYLDERRINRCISFAVDLFERPFMKLKKNNNRIVSLQPYLENSYLQKLIYKKPVLIKYLNLKNLLFILHKKYYRRLKYLLLVSLSLKKAEN